MEIETACDSLAGKIYSDYELFNGRSMKVLSQVAAGADTESCH